MNDQEMTNVYKLECYYIDHDGIGLDAVIQLLENTHYANHSPSPDVISGETRQVDWVDDNPLNYEQTKAEAFRKLFSDAITDHLLKHVIDELGPFAGKTKTNSLGEIVSVLKAKLLSAEQPK